MITEVNEMNNPQLRAYGNNPMDQLTLNDEQVEILEEHLNDYDEVESQIMDEMTEGMPMMMVEDANDVPFEVADNTEPTITEAPITNTTTYPKTQFISKENFSNFVESLSILKNIKQNVVFENGITYFVSDNNTFICKFNIHCPEISFKIPFVEQQSSQLSFLTKADSVSILETEDDYTFSNGVFKFQLRKSIVDTNTWNAKMFNKYYNDITSKPLIANYSFSDKEHLNAFLSIIKGVKRSNVEFVTDGNELVFNRGDANSGKFEMLRIPYNPESINNMEIDSMFDSMCMMYDYSSLNMSFYYNGEEADSLSVIINGIIDGYDITFMSIAYRSVVNRSI